MGEIWFKITISPSIIQISCGLVYGGEVMSLDRLSKKGRISLRSPFFRSPPKHFGRDRSPNPNFNY